MKSFLEKALKAMEATMEQVGKNFDMLAKKLKVQEKAAKIADFRAKV